MSKVFTLATELVDELVASAPNEMDNDEANAGVSMAKVLERARDEAENVKVKLDKIANVQEKMKANYNKEVEKLREERVEEIVTWKAMTLERQKIF